MVPVCLSRSQDSWPNEPNQPCANSHGLSSASLAGVGAHLCLFVQATVSCCWLPLRLFSNLSCSSLPGTATSRVAGSRQIDAKLPNIVSPPPRSVSPSWRELLEYCPSVRMPAQFVWHWTGIGARMNHQKPIPLSPLRLPPVSHLFSACKT